jgi:hypothetical protein
MRPRVIQLETPVHQSVQELLAWYVMDKLDPAERQTVDEHLLTCTLCRSELEWHRSMRTVHAQPLDSRGVEPALARINERIDATLPSRQAERRPGGWRGGWRCWASAWQASAIPIRLLIGGQALVIVALASALVLIGAPLLTPEADYRTLSASGEGPRADLVVVFAPQTSEEKMRHALQASGVRIVGGPTERGAYLLSAGTLGAPDALRLLRRQDAVVLAEALAPAGQP